MSCNSKITDTAIVSLLRASFVDKLECLNLQATGISEAVRQQLLHSSIAKQILDRVEQ